MADFAPNSTARIRLLYSIGRAGNRTFGLRVNRGATPAQLLAIAEDVSIALDGFSVTLRGSWTPTRWEYALTDSNTFLPMAAALPTLPNKQIGDPIDRSSDAIAATFSGRGANGSRARAVIYGLSINTITGTGQDFKVTSIEQPTLAVFTAALNALGQGSSEHLVAADNSRVTFYPYYNLKHNDYYVRQIRRLG